MAVVLRLARQGSKKMPYYRIVAADRRSPRNGRFIEQIGSYDPKRDPAAVRLDAERLQYWLSKGAEPSLTVKQIIGRAPGLGATTGAGTSKTGEGATA